MNTSLPTILIVDDSATTRAFIKRVITLTDLPIGTLTEAADGRAALQIMQSTPISIVLADLNMPVMDGIEMIAEMRTLPGLRDIPVVVISAQPDPEQIERLKASGVVAYLAKPFTPEDVRKTIEPLLGEPAHAAAHAPAAVVNVSLAEALAEALETMAFFSMELVDPAAPRPAEEIRKARVQFQGKDFRGSLSLSAPKSFGVAVARNCAVVEPESQSDDALKELTNVTCGLFLRKRVGGATGFVMGAPDVSTEAAMGTTDESDSVTVSAEGFIVAAHVTPQQRGN